MAERLLGLLQDGIPEILMTAEDRKRLIELGQIVLQELKQLKGSQVQSQEPEQQRERQVLPQELEQLKAGQRPSQEQVVLKESRSLVQRKVQLQKPENLRVNLAIPPKGKH